MDALRRDVALWTSPQGNTAKPCAQRDGAGMSHDSTLKRWLQEGIHYVVGPNVDDGAAAVRPVAEAKGIIYFPTPSRRRSITKPASNAVLGMVANYQSGPAIYNICTTTRA